MKHILVLIFLLALSCKNNKIVGSDSSHSENIEIIKNKVAADSIFEGRWTFESMNNNDSLKNKTFEINLHISQDNTYEGNYCSVSRNGNKIDCFEYDEPNIFGTTKSDTLYIRFRSSWEDSKGEAKLYFLHNNHLYWKITNSEGVLYLPDEVEMKKNKL